VAALRRYVDGDRPPAFEWNDLAVATGGEHEWMKTYVSDTMTDAALAEDEVLAKLLMTMRRKFLRDAEGEIKMEVGILLPCARCAVKLPVAIRCAMCGCPHAERSAVCGSRVLKLAVLLFLLGAFSVSYLCLLSGFSPSRRLRPPRPAACLSRQGFSGVEFTGASLEAARKAGPVAVKFYQVF
jgi:hypothetical protein